MTTTPDALDTQADAFIARWQGLVASELARLAKSLEDSLHIPDTDTGLTPKLRGRITRLVAQIDRHRAAGAPAWRGQA
jgi:hypothetical protein